MSNVAPPTPEGRLLEQIVNPVLLFVCLVVGGLGIALAMPRRGLSPQVLGALVAGLAFGVVFVVLGIRAAGEGQLPNLFFYIFALIALGSALRVITHPKPVYSALYFILTILSSASLFLLLHAEFMAFALIIIYAGAILITYLFVIMLATQAPTESQAEQMSEYDATSREPIVAVATGIGLLIMLSFMLARGVGEISPNAAARTSPDLLAEFPRKILRELDQRRVFDAFERPTPTDLAEAFDVQRRTVPLVVEDVEATQALLEDPISSVLFVGEGSGQTPEETLSQLSQGIEPGFAVTIHLPEEIRVSNAEGVGHALIAGHPMALELAGIILLMAMLGAVVLARKQIELSEEEKRAQAHRLGDTIDAAGGGA
ncbi:MAG: NADH-quinone oxidoreductase subunit J [Planctomycetota bacterium]